MLVQQQEKKKNSRTRMLKRRMIRLLEKLLMQRDQIHREGVWCFTPVYIGLLEVAFHHLKGTCTGKGNV